MDDDPQSWHPGHDVEEGAGPSGDLETKEEQTDPKPGAQEPVPGGGGGAAGAGGPSPESADG